MWVILAGIAIVVMALFLMHRPEETIARPKEREPESVRRVPGLVTPKHVWDQAVREFERGDWDHLRFSDDPNTQSVMNELEVRANDNAEHRRR